MSQPHVTDEELKRLKTGGPDGHRNGQAFASNGELTGRPALAHFYQPTQDELRLYERETLLRLRRHAHVVIPMRESKPVVHGVLSYLKTRVDMSKVLVVNCESNDIAIGAVTPFLDEGVTLVHMEDMFDMIDWTKLLPIVGLDKRPLNGKGWTVLAGMLAMYLLHPNATAVLQSDADLREVDRYDPLLNLGYPISKTRGTDIRYLAAKISRPGRGNETTMTARNVLADLARNPMLPTNVREIATHLAAALREHKWMLTGEFGLFGKVAFNRPFATGYCEETLISIFLETCIRHTGNGHTGQEAIAQVEARHNRIDDANDERKEFRMMDRISRFLIAYALFGKPITAWDITDYERFNAIFGQYSDTARIPSPKDEEEQPGRMSGPVIIEDLPQDRIVPSVKFLVKQGFVDMGMAEGWAVRQRR